ncbi:MAG: glycoside hydrolase family 127 protein [Planctomycetes bacterium]|jgi:hypothetical protein|nr:glycoside hydrolase family 127 protein [Planctomycetota bacterium]
MNPLAPVPASAVRLRNPGPARRVVESCLDRCEETGRIRNFAVAAGLATGEFVGRRYDDSDVYKTLEGAAAFPDLHPRAAEIARIVVAAQQPDGYLNTYYTLVEPSRRWVDLKSSHELYCLGHLIEAACAFGGGPLMDAASRFLELVEREFGPGRREDPPGHQEIELALLRLARNTGESRWRDLSRFFLERRGRGENRPRYGEYAQDHLPVHEQHEAVGHAVRALYMYCAMAEHEGLLPAAIAAFGDILGRKAYVTGGVGSRGEIEGFGEPYDLPVENAYCETCAAIALAMLARRLLLGTWDSRYADAYELILRNAVLAGVSLSGDRFFYANPLRTGGEHERVSWFHCACCPTNLARFLPQLPGDLYAVSADTLFVAQYAAGEAVADLAGTRVTIVQETGYPFSGAVRLRIDPGTETEFTLALRIPGWCAGPVGASVSGRPLGAITGPAWLRIPRQWRAGDEVMLRLPLVPRRVPGRREVKAERGLVALRYGPLVYCLEGADNPGDPREGVLPPAAPLVADFVPDLLGGATVLTAGTDPPLIAVPYALWGNRSPGPMTVWVREK